MSERETRVKKIESQIGANDVEDSGIINYSEYICACKQIFREMKEGKDLKEILERSTYNKKLKTELRERIPKLIMKLKGENVWEGEK